MFLEKKKRRCQKFKKMIQNIGKASVCILIQPSKDENNICVFKYVNLTTYTFT